MATGGIREGHGGMQQHNAQATFLYDLYVKNNHLGFTFGDVRGGLGTRGRFGRGLGTSIMHTGNRDMGAFRGERGYPGTKHKRDKSAGIS